MEFNIRIYNKRIKIILKRKKKSFNSSKVYLVLVLFCRKHISVGYLRENEK